jgi:hypothetical protein
LDEKLCEKQLPDTWQSVLSAAGDFLYDVPRLAASPTSKLLVCFYHGIKAVIKAIEIESNANFLTQSANSECLGAPVFDTSGLFCGILTQSGLLDWSKVKVALSGLSSASFASLAKTGSGGLKRARLVEPGIGITCYRATVSFLF